MKIAFTTDMKLGLNRFAAGDEFDIPDERFAQALIAAGHAKAAEGSRKGRPKEAETRRERTRSPSQSNYKTRQIKAEDSD